MLSSSACTRQIGSPSTSTRIIDSLGNSAVDATRCLVTLFNSGSQLLLHSVADLGDRDSVQDLRKKPLDQHPLGDRTGDAARPQVKEVLRIHRPDRGAVAAAQDVVVEDFEDWLGG